MKKDYQTILLEEIRDQNKALLEGQKEQASRADINRLERRLDTMESDVSSDLAEHKSLPVHVAHGQA